MATTYISVEDADAYLSTYGKPAVWSNAATPDKETALTNGTRYLDLLYGSRWVGTRADETQNLDWPRKDAVDSHGFEIDETTIPTIVRNATAEAAVRHLSSTGGLLPDPVEVGAVVRERVKAGPVETETEYGRGGKDTSGVKEFDAITRMLLSLLEIGNTIRLG